MYSVSATVGGVTMWLHDDTVSNSSVKLIDPVLTLEDSAAGSFTFKLAPNNIGYTKITVTEEMVTSVDGSGDITTDVVGTEVDLVERMRSTIKVYRDGTEIWEGRVLSEDRDFQNLRDIYCEGELAYLNDVCLPQRRYGDVTNRQFLEALLSVYNYRVDESKRIYVGYVTAHGGADSEMQPRVTSYEKVLEAVNKLVEEFGGHLRIRKSGGKRYLDWLNTYPTQSPQVIKFGSNLLDFTCNWDMSDLCTVVLPTGEVVEEANKSTVGDEVPCHFSSGSMTGTKPVRGHMLYLDTDATPNQVRIKSDSRLNGYWVGEWDVEPGKNYYLSCRLHGGLVVYAIKQSGGMLQTYETAGSADDPRFTDYEDKKITINPGCTKLLACGWGSDIPLCLKDETEPPEDYDKYLTVEQCATDVDATGKCWHQLGSIYVSNPELVTKYGWIERQIEYRDTADKDELYSQAKAYLQNGQFDKMTIEVSALDLHMLNVDTLAIDLLDEVRVISEPHGIDQWFPVTKIEIPLDRPEDQKFTIGSKTEQTLTAVNNNIDSELLAKISGIPTMSLVLDSAKSNAYNMIAAATHGYISMIDTDDDGQPNELVISSNDDLSQANSVWVFNVNGLGHFNHYPLSASEEHPSPGDTTNLALTMDGSIVADRITTGNLAAITINGCNATFGGLPNQQTGQPASGILKVKAGTTPQGRDPYCTTLKDGGVYFGTENSNGVVTDFANIRDNKTYSVNGSSWPGLVITVGDYKGGDTPSIQGVLALDIDALWVSEHSSNSSDPTKPDTMKTRGGLNQVFSFKDGDGNTQQMRFVHGILTEIITTPPPPEPEEEET